MVSESVRYQPPALRSLVAWCPGGRGWCASIGPAGSGGAASWPAERLQLADLAAAGGYYDQAQAREFRELAGCAPGRWLAEEFRRVQAGPPGTAEGSQP